MSFERIALKDRPLLESFLKKERHENSAHAFANIFIWKSLFEIYKCEAAGHLLVFFEDSSGCFLYLPPLGSGEKTSAVREAFRIMEERNGRAPAATRIENIEPRDTAFYSGLGLTCSEVSCDFLSLRDSIAGYKGNRFKHKRSARNYFENNYKFEYLPFSPEDSGECLALYDLWAEKRKLTTTDRIYRSFLDDNRAALAVLLDNYAGLGVTGRVIRTGKGIKAFTFGCEISEEVFTVLYEVADLSFKGMSQYLFSRFASELPYKYLNMTGDSGLENLRKAKLSFHPEKTVPSYIAVKPPR